VSTKQKKMLKTRHRRTGDETWNPSKHTSSCSLIVAGYRWNQSTSANVWTNRKKAIHPAWHSVGAGENFTYAEEQKTRYDRPSCA